MDNTETDYSFIQLWVKINSAIFLDATSNRNIAMT